MEEKKGFVIKDRRAFDKDGKLKKSAESMHIPDAKDTAKPDKQQKNAPQEKEADKDKKQQTSTPLPEVNFTTLIFSLSSSALFYLGEVADPETNQPKKDLALAKHTIDTISMLKDKTKGNLTDEEDKFITTVIADLKWRYVKAIG